MEKKKEKMDEFIIFFVTERGPGWLKFHVAAAMSQPASAVNIPHGWIVQCAM